MPEIVYCVAVTQKFPSAGLALAGKDSGLVISRDGAKTWRFAYQSLGLTLALPTMVLALAPEEDDRQAGIFAGVPGGVLSSLDGGETWVAAQLPEPPPVVSCLAISPCFAQDGVLLAGTVEDGVFRSADRGRSWSRWNFGLLDLNVLALAISPGYAEDETLFAGTETGIFRSTNGGRAWREVDFPMDLAPVLSLGISPFYHQDGLILAGTEMNGLHLSRDRGKTWQPASGIFEGETINAILVEGAAVGQVRLLALTSDRLLVSRDNGETWGEWENSVPEEVGISCLVAPSGLASGSPLLAGTGDGELLWI
jgi:photosystem II stability/assembly factor-like uncharacterized protein